MCIRDRCSIICVIQHLAVLIQYWSVTHTHKQIHDDGIYRAYHSAVKIQAFAQCIILLNEIYVTMFITVYFQ